MVTPHGAGVVNVQQIFDEAARSKHERGYDFWRWRQSSTSRRAYMQTLTALLIHGRERVGGRVLEVGCGAGTWTGLFATWASCLTAMDISDEMLRQAKQAVHSTNVSFKQGDFLEVALDPPFDAVVSVRALAYMNQEAFLERAMRLLAPGGSLVVITKNPHFGFHASDIYGARDGLHGRQISASRLAVLARQSGFESVHTYPAVVQMPRAIGRRLGGFVSAALGSALADQPIPAWALRVIESYVMVGRRSENELDGPRE